MIVAQGAIGSMNAIQRQVEKARRRLILARFANLACWSLFAAWLVAALAILARSIWTLPWDIATWDWAWLGGTTVAAVVIAAMVALLTAPSRPSVAAEVDSRFGLRERLSSVVSMPEKDLQSPMGQALVADATRRAEPLDVRDQFSLSPTRLGWLPALPAVVVAVAMFIGPANTQNAAIELSPELVSQTNQVKVAADSLKRKIQQQRQRAEDTGLKEAEEFFKKLETELDQLSSRSAIDQKDAMIAMNDLKKQLEQRREELGSSEQMKSALSKMEDMQRGPADEIVKAMQRGNFDDAKKQVKQLADQLREGGLNDQQKQELQKQIEQMREKLNQAGQKNEQAQQQLQQQIDQAKREGRAGDAAKMQQQMEQLQAEQAQLQQTQEMAEAMQQAAQALEEGKIGEAADALENLAEQLGEMQAEMQQLEDLKNALDDVAQSKQQMRCSSCSGKGCQQCDGGNGGGQGGDGGEGDGEGGSEKQNRGGGGSGIGTGTGRGDGDEEEIDAKTYDSQVRGEPKRGSAIIAGFADGPNRKGVSREEVKDAVLGAINDKSDPLENQVLPRVERDHTREYFNRLRQGDKP
jgi:cation transport regulator ChaC